MPAAAGMSKFFALFMAAAAFEKSVRFARANFSFGLEFSCQTGRHGSESSVLSAFAVCWLIRSVFSSFRASLSSLSASLRGFPLSLANSPTSEHKVSAVMSLNT